MGGLVFAFLLNNSIYLGIKMIKRLMLLFTLFVTSNFSNASILTPTSVSGTGSYNNSLSLITDGVFPAEGSGWTNGTNVYWLGTTPTFTINLGDLYNIDEFLLSVDNNDNYSVEWSNNSTDWNNLFSIQSNHGEVGWGMDTLSTDSDNFEYISALDFTSVQAQYLRIFATGGDNKYSIGEIQIMGSEISSVPVPATIWLFASALLGVIGFKRT